MKTAAWIFSPAHSPLSRSIRGRAARSQRRRLSVTSSSIKNPDISRPGPPTMASGCGRTKSSSASRSDTTRQTTRVTRLTRPARQSGARAQPRRRRDVETGRPGELRGRRRNAGTGPWGDRFRRSQPGNPGGWPASVPPDRRQLLRVRRPGKHMARPLRFFGLEKLKLTARTDYLVSPRDALLFLSADQPGVKAGNYQDRAFVARTTDGGRSFEFMSWITREPHSTRSVMPSSARVSNSEIVSALRRRDDSDAIRRNWIDLMPPPTTAPRGSCAARLPTPISRTLRTTATRRRWCGCARAHCRDLRLPLEVLWDPRPHQP